MGGGKSLSIRVLSPGLLTTIQDLGRWGYQKFGVVVGGAMDPFACRVANWLVGNEEGAAVLEITLLGPKLLFTEDTLLSLCGANLSPRVNGYPLPLWRTIWVRRGSVLSFGAPVAGCRAYLAVAGGFDLCPVMGSRSTYLRAGLGGWKGRALQAGDELPVQPPTALAQSAMKSLLRQKGWREAKSPFVASHWTIHRDIFPPYQRHPCLRVLRGPQFSWFTPQSQELFFRETFQVTTQSDRMGYRLVGPMLQLSESMELISEAVTWGTIQVPAGGQAIILMADRQTTGGYPKIAQVAAVDWPVLAQVAPGEMLRFRELSLAAAEHALLQREAAMQRLRKSIFWRLSGEVEG